MSIDNGDVQVVEGLEWLESWDIVHLELILKHLSAAGGKS